MSNPTLALAVDGMEFSLLDSWMEAGELPHLRQVQREGTHGTAACTSLSSAKQWTTHFTGVGDKTHGVSGFLRGDGKRQAGDDAPNTKELINLSDLEVLTYPELLSQAGYRVGLINPLPIWPPLDLEDGFCISGLLTPPDSDDWVSPPELEQELTDMEYRIDVRYGDRPYGFVDDAVFEDVDIQTLRRDLFEVLDARIEFTKRVIEEERVDFLYTLLKSIDVIQHCFWAHMEQEDPEYGEVIFDAYSRVDQFVGWILKRTDANMIVFGDHGFGPRTSGRLGPLERSIAKVAGSIPVPRIASKVYRFIFESADTDVDLTNPGQTTGTHKDPAAYLMSGPDIKDHGRIDIQFEDITPTLLAIADFPIPESYLGTPIKTALNRQPRYETVDLETRRGLDITSDDVVNERLHNLGYAEMVDDEG